MRRCLSILAPLLLPGALFWAQGCQPRALLPSERGILEGALEAPFEARAVPPCALGSLRHEGLGLTGTAIAQLVVHNCPGTFSDFPGCANGFSIIDGLRHVDAERYPLRLDSHETLAVDFDNLRSYISAILSRMDAAAPVRDTTFGSLGQAYARFFDALDDSQIRRSGPRRRVRDDGRVTAFTARFRRPVDVYTVDAAEINGCVYGFDAVDGPDGRVRIGVVLPDMDLK